MRLIDGIRFGNHFAVDPTVKTDLAVISHAHSDHLRSHVKLIATQPTLDMVHLIYKKFDEQALPFHEPLQIGPATVELAPAGHMLGSAQVIIDWRGERIVYTGDFKLEENLTCAKAEIHRCDVLLIDTTYGRPRYKFPPLSEVKEMLLDFVSNNLKDGKTPLILAYATGKSQEAMKMLGDEGFEMDVHQKAYDMAQIYIKHGVKIKNIHPLTDKPTPGHVVILPPGALRFMSTYGWGRFKTCFLSGWTLDKTYGGRNGRGYGIPFSDHAGFDDIIRYVEEAKPRRIFTLFGPPDIAEYLCRLGFKAQPAHFNSGHAVTPRSNSNFELFG
jgi:putative mRNA 3-end processing factor